MKSYKFHETLCEELMYKMHDFSLFNFHKNIKSDDFNGWNACKN